MTRISRRAVLLTLLDRPDIVVSRDGQVAQVTAVWCVHCRALVPFGHRLCEQEIRTSLRWSVRDVEPQIGACLNNTPPRGPHPMTDSITITRDTAVDLAMAEEGETVDRFTVVSEGQADDDDLCELVIRDDADNLWATVYTSHPEIPLFHGEETVNFTEVIARKRVVTEYVKPAEADADPEREWARALVEDAVEGIDFMGVGERFEDAWAELSPEEFDARQERVHTLATKANVTVTFPETERGQG
jgi:hypothetical protein